MTSPYDDFPRSAFWRTAVADVAALDIDGIAAPKFILSREDRVATLGSCFAQHIGRELRRRGYNWFEAERPIPGFPPEVDAAFHYGVFSFRTGNIYTPRALIQWLDWATGAAKPPADYWTAEARVVDPFRPAIEPEGFDDEVAAAAARHATLSAIAASLRKIDVVVFTLGQTEAWRDRDGGHVFAVCPGTAGGTFDAGRHEFVNFSYADCLADMERAIAHLRHANPRIKVILTVSPVPMVATASGQHVLVANTRTKSTLRAVATTLAESHPDVDYFPSYELITQPPFRAMFYDPNLRTVCRAGVDFVMSRFFAAHGADDAAATGAADDAPGRRRRQRAGRNRPEQRAESRPPRRGASRATATITTAATTGPAAADSAEDDLVCEEIMLDAALASRRERV